MTTRVAGGSVNPFAHATDAALTERAFGLLDRATDPARLEERLRQTGEKIVRFARSEALDAHALAIEERLRRMAGDA